MKRISRVFLPFF